MKWFLIVLYMQSNHTMVDQMSRVAYAMPSKEACDASLKNGKFDLNKSSGSDALVVFCSTDSNGNHRF